MKKQGKKFLTDTRECGHGSEARWTRVGVQKACAALSVSFFKIKKRFIFLEQFQVRSKI